MLHFIQRQESKEIERKNQGSTGEQRTRKGLALVHGSIGYTPLGAENCVGEYVRGQRGNYSERCASSSNCNLGSEILHDIEALRSDKQSKIIEEVREAGSGQSGNVRALLSFRHQVA
ncbi:MAG: hypothetical protein JRN20_13180 [Nitrososphaerota archaeon]|nr:hypothetical protein [Nitrososphaerota archaeon]